MIGSKGYFVVFSIRMLCVVFLFGSVSAQGESFWTDSLDLGGERMIGLLAFTSLNVSTSSKPDVISVFVAPNAPNPISGFSRNDLWEGKLPSLEYDYEEKGPIILEQRKGWYRIKLAEGSGWVKASATNKMLPLESLFLSHTPAFSSSWDGLIFDSPEGVSSKLTLQALTAVKVLSHESKNGNLWFKIQFPVEDSCGDVNASIEKVTAWIPAYAKRNKPTMWFHSRGC